MLTVVMATYNGSRTLPEVLSAYCNLHPVNGGWKLVVVDNGSTDSTKQVVESFQSRLPLTYIFEPELGKSTALNTGLRHFSGDLVVLTDDDAVPRPQWLQEFRVAADKHSDFSVFAGAIVPRWEVPPEDWILDWAGPVLAITDPAWQEGPIKASFVYGPNMAVRAEVIRAGHRFDPTVGPVGRRYRMGEDTDFVERLTKTGLKAWHCKRAIVAHIIRKHQMKKKWLLGRAVARGCVDYQREMKSNQRPALVLGVPRHMIREILTQGVRVVHARLTSDSRAALKERWWLYYLVGRAIGGRRTHSKPQQAHDRAPRFS